jgi:ribosomal protein S18 acetylase RimI-like enzyme
MKTPNSEPGGDSTLVQVETIAKRLFGDAMDLDEPILGISDDDFIAPNVREMLQDPDTTVATLVENGVVVGFSVAIPIGKMHRARHRESDETAYIYFTGIDPVCQGKGLIAKLMDDMVAQLKARGYSFVERDCVLTQSYADNVEKVFAGAIVEKYDHTRWPEVGPECFFRIDLSLL